MNADGKIYLQQYKVTNPVSYQAFSNALDITNKLIGKLHESYIIGKAVRNMIIGLDISDFVILTTAPFNTLKELFPSIYLERKSPTLKINNFKYSFMEFKKPTDLGTKDDFYNHKLEETLKDFNFSFETLAMSPKGVIVDLYNGIEDIKNKEIKLIDVDNNTIKDKPFLILKTFCVQSELDFTIHKHLLRSICNNNKLVTKLNDLQFSYFFRIVLDNQYGKKVLSFIEKNDILIHSDLYSELLHKLNKNPELNYIEQLTLVYLTSGKISDKALMPQELQYIIPDYFAITNKLLNEQVSPMMVYTMGEQTLLSCDKIAAIYKKKYHSQSSRIRKLSKNKVIKNIRDLNFTKLELITLLGGNRNNRIQIIFNILLERVINGFVPNANVYLKQEAKKVIDELNKMFNYDEVDVINYSDDDLLKLKDKYLSEYNFLVHAYLNEYMNLYDLDSAAIFEIKKKVSNDAKEFLLSSTQYNILVERGLI